MNQNVHLHIIKGRSVGFTTLLLGYALQDFVKTEVERLSTVGRKSFKDEIKAELAMRMMED
ncbi:MAG TPA: hypothetical protein VN426_06195 [Syntrophomonadaceae bacterium]|nr:hypothetical protein [Syntrophomonadaceae bacterium]